MDVTHRPEADYSVHTARAHAGTTVVDVPVRKVYDHYRGRKAFNARVDLLAYEGDGVPYLVLDGLDEAELSHYCESRASRVDYMDYLALFTHARKALAAEFAAVREIDARIADALAADLRDRDPADVRAAARTAHRLWRAEHGAALPTPRQEREIRDAAFLVLTRTPTPEAIAAVSGSPVPEIVRAGTTGRGHLVVVTDGPADPILAPGTWTRRRTYVPAKDGAWRLGSDRVATMPREADPSIAETVRGPAAARHVEASRLPEGVASPEDTAALLARIRLGTPDAVARDHLGPVDPRATIEAWFRRAHALTFRERPSWHGRHGVVEPWTHTVIGAAVAFRPDAGGDRRQRVALLAVASDPLARALLADPACADLLCRDTGRKDKRGEPVYDGRLADLWRGGGLWRLERAQGRATRMAGPPGTRDMGHPFWLSTLRGPVAWKAAMGVPGPTVEHSADDDLRRAWSYSHPEHLKDHGDWIPLMSQADMPTHRDGAAGPVGRLVVRGDTWDLVSGLVGWSGVVPPDLEIVRL